MYGTDKMTHNYPTTALLKSMVVGLFIFIGSIHKINGASQSLLQSDYTFRAYRGEALITSFTFNGSETPITSFTFNGSETPIDV